MATPLGLFGGAFDPVHFGHLRLATELRAAFGLPRVVFLPTGDPWQRGRPAWASGADRVAMLRLATAGEPAFAVDDREVRRPGPTYTVETLAEFRREQGPDAPLVFLCGTDAFAKIETWHRWEALFDYAHFAVAVRAEAGAPGAWREASVPAALRHRIATRPEEVLSSPAGRIMAFPMTPLAISSTAIRDLVRAAGPIRYLTPDPVVDFILQRSPYGKPA